MRPTYVYVGFQPRPRYSDTQDAGCPSSAETGAEARHEATSLLRSWLNNRRSAIYAGRQGIEVFGRRAVREWQATCQ